MTATSINEPRRAPGAGCRRAGATVALRLALLTALLLAGCGQKGPLWVPGHAKNTPWPMTPAGAGTSAPASTGPSAPAGTAAPANTDPAVPAGTGKAPASLGPQ